MLSKLIGKRFLFLISIYCFLHLSCYGGPTTPRDCGGDEAFQCGSIMYIAYPFWGGNRPEICGRSGFELVCQGNVPIINISSMSYRVIEMDFETNTLTVAREDLWNTTCPTSLRNATIDPDLFQYSDGQDKNVSLFYNCTGADGQGNSNSLPNKFNCDTNKPGTFNVFAIGDAASSPGPNIMCADSIYVPVNKDKAKSLKTLTRSSINILQPALAAGFSIQWVEDSLQRTEPFCNRVIYGSCLRTKLSQRSCTRPNSCTARTPSPTRRRSPAPAPAPEPNATKDSSSVPSPAPEGDHHSQRGFHPVQTGGFSPGPGPFNISTTRKGHLRSSKEIIIGLVAGITAIALGSLIIYWCLVRQRSRIPLKQNHYPMLEKHFLEQGSLAPKRYKYYELKQITRFFSDKLGQGGFGSVYKGALPDGCPVAVKVLTETHSDGEEFINEVVSISRTSHINIINLLGFCYEKNKRALIYEYMPNKSLDKFIGDSGSSNEACCLDLETLYNIALGVAKGLEYLHNGCNTRIVHFDIKPQNILLDEDFCPKISDFGLAKLCKKKQSVLSMLGARGTIGYIAPEIFSRNFGRVSHKSDVYSYGMMVLDMVGAKENTVVAVAQSSENYFPDKIYEQLLLDLATTEDECVMVEEQEERRRKLFLVGFWCIQTIPANRPPISKVVEMLEGSLEAIKIPPKPFLFHPMLSDQELSPSLSMYEETNNSDSAEIAVVN